MSAAAESGDSSCLLKGGKGGLGGTPWLSIEMHPSAWRVRRPRGVGVLACWNCDLCNQQAPSHSKHAISPQTEACFSTTHGFNWRLLPPPPPPPLLLLLLLCLQLWKKRGRHSSTNLIMKSVAGRQMGLAASPSRGDFCGGLREDACIPFSWEALVFSYVFMCMFVCEQACI